MTTFIEGTYLLAKDISDFAEYQNAHKKAVEETVDLANEHEIDVQFAEKDNCFIVDYEIVRENYTACKNILTDLQSVLRAGWGKIENLYQSSGDYIPPRS
jgi:hypothetical protein